MSSEMYAMHGESERERGCTRGGVTIIGIKNVINVKVEMQTSHGNNVEYNAIIKFQLQSDSWNKQSRCWSAFFARFFILMPMSYHYSHADGVALCMSSLTETKYQHMKLFFGNSMHGKLL